MPARLARLLLALIGLSAAGVARAQETSALARPEPKVPILYLAPPPAPEVAPEDRRLGIATLIIPPPPSASAVALPPPARALLEEAINQGSADSFAAIAALARERYPEGGAQIDALAAENDAKRAERAANEAREKADALAAASFLDNWRGEIDLGGSYTRGNTDAVSIYGALKLNKEGLHWRHAVSARADYAKSAGALSTDKDTAAYQPQYKFDERFYAYGLGQFDRDEILGFSRRFTQSVGAGYTVLPGNILHLDLEAGPAVRETRYAGTARFSDTAVGGRASVNFLWKPNGAIQFTEKAAVFFLPDNTNITSTTALDTKLFGPLRVRLSYNLTYEQDTPTVARSFDTITTASIVFAF
jgi:putative salt-induced outer membrane protein